MVPHGEDMEVGFPPLLRALSAQIEHAEPQHPRLSFLVSVGHIRHRWTTDALPRYRPNRIGPCGGAHRYMAPARARSRYAILPLIDCGMISPISLIDR